MILFSLGSVTTNDSMKPEIIDAFVKAFAKIPQRVLWKFTGQIDGLSENVWLSEWLPQKEVLGQYIDSKFVKIVKFPERYGIQMYIVFITSNLFEFTKF